MKATISFFQAMLLSILIGILIVVLFFLSDINKIRKTNSAELLYNMTNTFFVTDTISKGIIKALGDQSPVLQENGGKFDYYDVDNYLAHFELLKNYLDEGIISEKNIYTMYSYYIVQAYKNKEIWEYVKYWREYDKDSTYYANVEFLAKRFIEASKNKKFPSH